MDPDCLARVPTELLSDCMPTKKTDVWSVQKRMKLFGEI